MARHNTARDDTKCRDGHETLYGIEANDVLVAAVGAPDDTQALLRAHYVRGLLQVSPSALVKVRPTSWNALKDVPVYRSRYFARFEQLPDPGLLRDSCPLCGR